MLDPGEGIGPDGSITTGARRHRVPAAFEPLLGAAVAAVGGAPLYLYGSVATGQARVGVSDVDLIGIGLAADTAAQLGDELSQRFRSLCRAVEIGASRPGDVEGCSDEAYGNRVFLRHYCVQIAGPARTDLGATYPADVRAARGFNGDIAAHAERWRHRLAAGEPPPAVATRLARKTLLAVAGLVSIHDRTWTTDRGRAARRWAEIDPPAAPDLHTLLAWTTPTAVTRPAVEGMLEGTVARLVTAFHETIGLWPGEA